MKFTHTPALAAGVALLAAASAATAQTTVNYGWEDGTGTILGSFTGGNDNLAAANVTGGSEIDYGTADVPQSTYTVGPFEGDRLLQLTEAPPSGTPNAVLAFVDNLVDGDTVEYSFRAFDPTDGRSPSVSSNAVYTTEGNPNSFAGFATPQQDFLAGTGYLLNGTSFTFDDGEMDDRTGAAIRASLFAPSATPADGSYDFFIDALSVTVTSSSPTASITLPDGSVTLVNAAPIPEPAGLAAIGLGGLALLRRRRA